MTEEKKKLPKVPLKRTQFYDNVFGVDVVYELHKPPYMEVPENPDPVFWHKNHEKSNKTFRKWYVFKNKKDFEKFFMAYQGSVPKLTYWKEAEQNQWCLADDGGVCEIIKKGKTKNKHMPFYVRTIVGSFMVYNKPKDYLPFVMDTDFARHPDRSRFSGIKYYNFEDYLKKRKHIDNKEKVFAYNVAHGADLIESYLRCYPKDKEKKPTIINHRALLLVKQERIKREVSKQLKDIMEEQGIDHEFLIKKMKELVRKMEEGGDYRGAMEGLKNLGKSISTFETPTNKAVRGGIINMIESLSSFSVDADVEELEDDMEVKQIEDKKDE